MIFLQVLNFPGILPILIFFGFRAAKSLQRGLLELYKCAYESGPDRQGCWFFEFRTQFWASMDAKSAPAGTISAANISIGSISLWPWGNARDIRANRFGMTSLNIKKVKTINIFSSNRKKLRNKHRVNWNRKDRPKFHQISQKWMILFRFEIILIPCQ